jgi:hypothetical protein
MAALLLTASISQASILEAWMTYATSGTAQPTDGNPIYGLPAGETAPTASDVGNLYTVMLWIKIVPDPSLGETTASIAGGGLETAALSIVPMNLHFQTAPNPMFNDPIDYPTTVDDDFPNVGVNGLNNKTIDAAREIGGVNYGDTSGALDALQASGGNKGNALNPAQRACALNTTFLFATENWVATAWPTGPVPLHLIVAGSSDHWDSTVANQKDLFSQIETGTLVNGNFVAGGDLIYGAPEPATLALLGFGAVATLLRRRNKK